MTGRQGRSDCPWFWGAVELSCVHMRTGGRAGVGLSQGHECACAGVSRRVGAWGAVWPCK